MWQRSRRRRRNAIGKFYGFQANAINLKFMKKTRAIFIDKILFLTIFRLEKFVNTGAT